MFRSFRFRFFAMACRVASLLLLVTVVNFIQAGTGYGRGKNNGFGHVNGMRRFPRREHSHLERKAERRVQARADRGVRHGQISQADGRVAQCAVLVAAVCLPVFGTYWLIQNANTRLSNFNSAGYFVKN